MRMAPMAGPGPMSNSLSRPASAVRVARRQRLLLRWYRRLNVRLGGRLNGGRWPKGVAMNELDQLVTEMRADVLRALPN